MRVLASRLSTFLCRRSLGHVQSCNFSSHNAKAKGLKSKYHKCHGAGILARYAYAIDDKRRMKIVEIGGAQELVHMLRDARDDNKQLTALKALVALSGSDEAVAVLHRAGAISVIKSTPQKWITYPYLHMDIEDPEFKKRFQDL